MAFNQRKSRNPSQTFRLPVPSPSAQLSKHRIETKPHVLDDYMTIQEQMCYTLGDSLNTINKIEAPRIVSCSVGSAKNAQAPLLRSHGGIFKTMT